MRISVATANILLLAGTLACSGDAGGPPAGGTAVYCTAALPDVLNTFVTPDVTASDVRWLLFTPLVRYDAEGSAMVPWLAIAWRWNSARTEVDVALRTDIVWHDGETLDADDVAWTIRIAADPVYGYVGADDLAGLLAAEPIAADTVRLRFDRPLIAEMEPFTALPILPRHLLDTIPAERFDEAAFHRSPVGSGPFRFTERTVDGAVVLTRHEAFPEALGRAGLDRLILRGVPEVTSQLVELQTGNVEACVMGSSRAADVEQNAALRALPVPPTGIQVIPLNGRQAPLDDVRVRRALSAALDRSTLATSLSSLIQPARTFLPPGSRWLDATLLQPDADSARAAAVLDSAGWRPGPDGIRRNAAGRPLRFTLAAPQPLRNLLTVVQAQWRRVGIDVELRFLEGAAYVAMIREPSTRPAAMALSFIPDRIVTPDPWEQLNSEGGNNLAAYRNATVDSLTALLRTPLADAERAAAYHQVQRRVMEDVPLLYLLHAPRLLAVHAELDGVLTDRNGPFASVAAWRVTR